ncbi:hypothetical protein FA13DRAFT_1281856 [Coprinellus micaceus]|uniref:Uncharacterized protein n=1 Tax=Coprinellus micaceus TaxID=71717 RepID=A0A4Y7R8R3_COPMI|nr:hypothetical protein FA13DRAFT_1281856 [Coprinellus micaceus]
MGNLDVLPALDSAQGNCTCFYLGYEWARRCRNHIVRLMGYMALGCESYTAPPGFTQGFCRRRVHRTPHRLDPGGNSHTGPTKSYNLLPPRPFDISRDLAGNKIRSAYHHPIVRPIRTSDIVFGGLQQVA